jgi:hypothetical protein
MLKVIGTLLVASSAATAQQIAFDSYDPVNGFARDYYYPLSGSGYDRLGMSFTAVASGGVQEVWAPVFYGVSGSLLEIEFYTAASGAPAQLVGSRTFASANWTLHHLLNPTSQGVLFQFDGAIPVSAGQDYFLVMHRITGNGGWMLSGTPGAAPVGTTATSTAGGAWTTESSTYTAFRVVVPTPGAFAVFGLGMMAAARRRR